MIFVEVAPGRGQTFFSACRGSSGHRQVPVPSAAPGEISCLHPPSRPAPSAPRRLPATHSQPPSFQISSDKGTERMRRLCVVRLIRARHSQLTLLFYAPLWRSRCYPAIRGRSLFRGKPPDSTLPAAFNPCRSFRPSCSSDCAVSSPKRAVAHLPKLFYTPKMETTLSPGSFEFMKLRLSLLSISCAP